MNVPPPYPPLPVDHPAVRDALLCPCCETPFAAGDVTCLWPVGEADEDNVCEARLLHHACMKWLTVDVTVQAVYRERLRSPVDGAYAGASDTVRLNFLERRLREHGPDLGYLLGLPQGWTNLRAAVDQAQASSR